MDRTDKISLLLALCLTVLGIAALTAAAGLQRTDTPPPLTDRQPTEDRREAAWRLLRRTGGDPSHWAVHNRAPVPLVLSVNPDPGLQRTAVASGASVATGCIGGAGSCVSVASPGVGQESALLRCGEELTGAPGDKMLESRGGVPSPTQAKAPAHDERLECSR